MVFKKFQTMKKFRYQKSTGDDSLFFKHYMSRKVFIMIFYVDYIIISDDGYSEITKLKSPLESVFEIRDLGKLKYFLEIEVSYSASDST